VIRVVDEGAGIADTRAVLAPGFKSRTGLGIGLKGSRALMDRFELTSVLGQGTTVVMAKRLPWSTSKFGAPEVARLAAELAKAGERRRSASSSSRIKHC
jgi:Anti-sigma regulatory factor (Ser/Thr protein kinase)